MTRPVCIEYVVCETVLFVGAPLMANCCGQISNTAKLKKMMKNKKMRKTLMMADTN